MFRFRIPKCLVARIVLAVGVAGAAAPWAAGQAPSDACEQLWGTLQSAIQARELKAAAEAASAVRRNPDCGERRVKAHEVMFDHYREEVARLEREKAPPAVQLATLTAALKYGRTWDLMARIGDLKSQMPDASGRPDFAGASQAYDRAVGLIDDLPAQNRPQPAAIKRLNGLAFQYEQLSPTPVPRQALLRNVVRQIDPGPAVFSLQFQYDSHQMTEGGRVQADNLFKLLKDKGMPQIHLVGHTDPKGSHEYNDGLSVRRAKAVKDFLREKGYPESKISTEGRGKRDIDKLPIYDRTKFTEEQVHQMLRRVSLDLRQKQ